MKLTIQNLYNLSTELTGFYQDKQIMQGLLSQDLDLSFKYDLHILLKNIEEHLEKAEESRFEIIKKYGEQTSENVYQIPKTIDNQPNPNLDAAKKELEKLGEKEVEITIPTITKAMLQGIKTNEFYPTIFSIIS